MLNNFVIKILALRNNLTSKGIESKKRERFAFSSKEINQLIDQLDKDESFHILLHSHYDPAWFARRNVTRNMLVSFYKKVIKLMEENDEYKFTADSQTQILEDILSNFSGKKKINFRKKLSGYIASGRLVAGPYYAGIDLNLSSGAVLRRNILYGIIDTKEFGWDGPHTGWMIDQFGFPAQMWQLHKKFGINSIILWRGLGLKPDEAKTEVLLESPDGSRILGKWLFVQGYRFGLYIGKYSDIGVPRLIQESKKIQKYTVSNSLLIMDGYEGEDTPDNPEKIVRLVKEIGGKAEMSTPRIFMSELEKKVDGVNLPVVRGYQNYGYYSPVLKGVISSRQYVKQSHQLCDDTLTKLVDPMAVLAGFFKIEQNWDKIEHMWRDLIRMASHDELGGCGIDDIHRDSMAVYEKIYSESVLVIKNNMMKIGGAVKTDFSGESVPVILFNTLPYDRLDTVRVKIDLPSKWKYISVCDSSRNDFEVQILNYKKVSDSVNRVEFFLKFDKSSKLPAFGYKTVYISNSKERYSIGAEDLVYGERWMENSKVRVGINPNGTFDLLYKATGRVYRNLGYIRVEPDGGDTYDFSHIKNHKVLTTLDLDADINLDYAGNLEIQYKISFRLMVPGSITEDRSSWSENKKPLEISLLLSLRKDSPRLDLKVLVDNDLKDSRIRVCFPVETEAEDLYVNRQFDVYRMPIISSGLSVEEKKDISSHMDGMISSGMDVVEVKTNINFKWVDIPVKEEKESVADESLGIINRDNFEFEVRESSDMGKVVEFTLLRSVGWNARPDLLTRNINAGWEIYTPDAFCYGRYLFDFSILPHNGDWLEGQVHKEADSRFTEVQVARVKKQKGVLPPEFSLFRTVTKSIIVSEITRKREENLEKIIFSLYNPGEITDSIVFIFNGGVKNACITELDGKFAREVVLGDRDEFSLSLRGKEIIELTVELSNEGFEIPKNLSESDNEIMEEPVNGKMLEMHLDLEMRPKVDWEEVAFEKKRWFTCRRRYRNNIALIKTGNSLESLDDFIHAYREKESLINLENTVKEAHYSYLLTLKRFYETRGKFRAVDRVEKNIAKMGRSLINLRVKKRETEIYRVFYENLKSSR